MKITVIGHWGAYPEPNDATSAYLIEVNSQKILLDCGSGALSSLTNYCKLEDLDAIVLSHYHYDHFIDIFPLHYAMDILMKRGYRERPLKIYAIDDKEYFQKIPYKDVCEAHEIKEDTILDIEGVKISFTKTKHQVMCFAIKVTYDNKTVVYSADTGWDENLIPFVKDADLFICEASLLDSQQGMNDGHLTSTEAGKLAEMAQVKRLMITHFPHKEDTSRLEKEANNVYQNGRIYSAKKGRVIEF